MALCSACGMIFNRKPAELAPVASVSPITQTTNAPVLTPEPAAPTIDQTATGDNIKLLKLLGWTKEQTRVPDNLTAQIQAFVKNPPAKSTLLITGYCDGSANTNAKDVAISRGSNARSVAINAGYPMTKIRVRYITFAKQDGITLEWKQ